MKHYDVEQQRAIDAAGGYFLVLAPPGCGKTDILTERIAHAHEQGTPYADMLCLTFTNRASRSMLERVVQRLSDRVDDLFVGNTHRFCSSFLFDNALVPANASIVDDDEVCDILHSFDEVYFQSPKGGTDRRKVARVDDLEGYIRQRRMGHPEYAIPMPKEEYEPLFRVAEEAGFCSDNVEENALVRYALRYGEYKQRFNLISFSDILILAYEALRRDTERQYKRYRWIEIDEVQDLNGLQLAIIDELTDTTADYTVMFLGDEQQAIYSFLGAKRDLLERLRKRCGSVMTFCRNYRSPQYLLDVFNRFAEAELGVDAALLPQASQGSEHDRRDLILAGNQSTRSEDARVAAMVQYYLGLDERERVAILVSTNNDAERISRVLEKCGIAHFKISGVDFFKQLPYKMISSAIAVNVNPFNTMAWTSLLYGVGAITTRTWARDFMAELSGLMMTPFDLARPPTYLEDFCNAYETEEIVLFDTETTGLNVVEDEIVQIAAFKIRGGRKVEGSDLNIFLHTDRAVPPMLGDIENPLVAEYAEAVHYDRAEGLRLFLDYIGSDAVLGHNVMFDYRILQYNVEHTLHERIELRAFDSLMLAKYVEPRMKRYKLKSLLESLNLQGENSHLANDDIVATQSLVDYCYAKAQPMVERQRQYKAREMTARIVDCLRPLMPYCDRLQGYIYKPVSITDHSLADELRDLHDEMVRLKYFKQQDGKFDIFLRYVQNEWCDSDVSETLMDQISNHYTELTASIGEGDLVNSPELIDDRVFVMTVHKGKGLEFDNVVILGANKGTYPYYTAAGVLANRQHYSKEAVEQARRECLEDARKFYVALTRAKRRICVSYVEINQNGFPAGITPFMDHIKQYFLTGGKK